MNRSTAKLQVIARRLIAYEARPKKSSDANGTAAFRVCDKLRLALGQLAGAAGFHALLSRALTLGQAEVPCLTALQIKADGVLEYPEQRAELDQAEMTNGEV